MPSRFIFGLLTLAMGWSLAAAETNGLADFHFLVPGFTAKELPVAIKNINNVRYRRDGKLVAVGYDGKVYLLSDTDGDGFEDTAKLWWDKDSLRVPLGMALTPPGYARGDGIFLACVGKVVLLLDTNKDDILDTEIVVATGWPEVDNRVDAIGVALGKDGSLYFGVGIGTAYANAYRLDKDGVGHVNLAGERGTIMKVSPDFKTREIIATGIRFSVGMAFNRLGDLFSTDQEGATWLPNGNPFDELLHIQSGRHYGFPPRHPRHLPNVIDEPSVFDYAPQHQSTCGLCFNDPVNNGPTFGPRWWSGDALVTGASRGKLYRTKLVKTVAGYVAQNQLLANINKLAVDVCVSPKGDLIVSDQGGRPDWGSGPAGFGQLVKVSHTARAIPQPLFAYGASSTELRVTFDAPLDREQITEWARHAVIEGNRYLTAGDRFESMRPGYDVVNIQRATPRLTPPIQSLELSTDAQTLILHTTNLTQAVNYAVSLDGFYGAPFDFAGDLTGVEAAWAPRKSGNPWLGWLPSPDLAVARELTAPSTAHQQLWKQLRAAGMLTLRGQLNLWQMLQPAIQPNAKIDWEPPVELVTVTFQSRVEFELRYSEKTVVAKKAGKVYAAEVQATGSDEQWLRYQIALPTGSGDPQLDIAWHTDLDPRPRALALRRSLVPWATPPVKLDAVLRTVPELAGGSWVRGRKLFFSETVACSKCHEIETTKDKVGPSLMNLAYRDYVSVLRDIREPSASINPDYLSYEVTMKNGDTLTGVIRGVTDQEFTLMDGSGKANHVNRSETSVTRQLPISLMPEGILATLKPDELRDLMTYLLTRPEGTR